MYNIFFGISNIVARIRGLLDWWTDDWTEIINIYLSTEKEKPHSDANWQKETCLTYVRYGVRDESALLGIAFYKQQYSIELNVG